MITQPSSRTGPTERRGTLDVDRTRRAFDQSPVDAIGHSPVSSKPSVQALRPLPLAARLDAALTVLSAVAWIGRDHIVEAVAETLGRAAGLIIRRTRLDDGRLVTFVAVPMAAWTCPNGKAEVLALKYAARAVGRCVVLVPAGALDREPRVADPLLVASCAGAHVSVSDRLDLSAALLDTGGSMPLADAAGIMVQSQDPVAAVLALVAGHVLGLDLRQPIGPATPVLARPFQTRSEAGR